MLVRLLSQPTNYEKVLQKVPASENNILLLMAPCTPYGIPNNYFRIIEADYICQQSKD